MEDSVDGGSSKPRSDVQPAAEAEEALGPGKRKQRPNTLYNSNIFWRHHDNEDPNDEPECSD